MNNAMSLPVHSTPGGSFMQRLNGQWHELALRVFMVIALAHWAEHVLQAIQIFVLKMPRPQALGALGFVFPWLVKSEWLHYFYAIVMLVALIVLRPAFQGRSRTWWNIALWIQVWHHIEHLLLLGQVLVGVNLFGKPVPTSILQLFFLRAELHLFYNAVVFIPMLVAMYYHLWPPASERNTYRPMCACAHEEPAAA